MWALSNSEIIALSSVTIALLALITTFWQAHISRRHNRLSIRPFVVEYQERFPGEHISVSIVNRGIGPALVEECYFTIPPNSQKLDIDGLIDKIVLQMKCKVPVDSETFSGKTMLPPGKITSVIKFELTSKDDENFRIISKILDDVSIHIVYRSLYKELFRYSETLHLVELFSSQGEP
jgi:hypothetical protein